jgi:hypothetical protein
MFTFLWKQSIIYTKGMWVEYSMGSPLQTEYLMGSPLQTEYSMGSPLQTECLVC